MSRPTRTLWSSVVAATAFVVVGTNAASASPVINHEVVIDGTKVFMRSNYAEAGARANASFGSDTQQPAGWHGNYNFRGVTSLGFVADHDRDGWDTGPIDGDYFAPAIPYEGWAIQVGTNPARWNTNSQTDIAGAWSGSGTSPGAFADWDASAAVDGIDVSMRYRMPSNGDPAVTTEATLTNTTGGDLEVIYARALDADNCATKTDGCDYDGDGNPDGGYWTDVLQKITAQRANSDSITAVQGSQTDGSAITLWTTESDSMAFSAATLQFCYSPPQLATMLDLPLTYTPASPADIANNCSTSYVSNATFFNAPGTSKFIDDVMIVAARRLIPAGGTATISLTYSMYSVDPAASVNTKAPSISGTPEIGRTLTADSGDWTNSPTSYAYQWLRCAVDGTACAPIDGASGSTYTLAPSDVGATLRVSVRASNAAGEAAASTESSPSGTVAAGEGLPPTGSGDLTTVWLLVGAVLIATGILVRRSSRRSAA